MGKKQKQSLPQGIDKPHGGPPEEAKEPTQKELLKQLSSEQAKRLALEKENERLVKKLANEQARNEEQWDRVGIEREIRRYVKRGGGYRKGLAGSDKARCARLIILRAKLSDNKGKESLGVRWDHEVEVPGLDQPTVASYTFDGTTGQMKSTR